MRLLPLSAILMAVLLACTVDLRRKPAVAVPEFIPPKPTATFPPTATPIPTPTATPRSTSKPTSTSTPRPTPRPTRTPVPVPPTAIPAALDATPTPLLRSSLPRERERAAPELQDRPAEAPTGDLESEVDEPAELLESPAAPPAQPSADERLRAVAAERARFADTDSYQLGPGDMVSITVFDLEEMTRKVRVSRRGEVQLPLIGAVRAAGRSEAELAGHIATLLERDYLQDPQVDVFVEEYRSQQVAVTGSVAKPGLVPLTRDRYTILDVISEAGGLTKDAGSFIEFIPARRKGRSRAFELARSVQAPGEEIAGQGIQIELEDLMRGAGGSAMSLPVIAGDVVYVPEAGSFSIDGWVDKPGTYPVTRGMTVLGAISAGGGPLFPAALGRVELLRTSAAEGEERGTIEIDVDAIKDGEEADVSLRAGDVIRINANPLLVPPWAVYQLFRDLIRLGASVPVA